ncbi:MAG: trypsin-like serine protease [Kofleriaceae bacterium]
MSHFTKLSLLSLVAAGCINTTESPSSGSVIEHEDGTYSLAPPAGRGQGSTVRKGALTWSYVGQARHTRDPQPMHTMEYVTAAPTPIDEREQVRSMMWEDEHGSIWRVGEADMGQVRALLAARDADSAETRLGLTKPGAQVAPQAVEEPGRRVRIDTMSWTGSTCGNHYYMGDDDRVQVSGSSSTRRKAIVEVRVSGQTACTGVILRDRWVLTAAHCIFDSATNLLIDRSAMSVRRWDGVDTTPIHSLSGRVWDAEFTSPGTDPKDDWALLHLSTSFQAPFYDMDISAASDTTLSNLTGVVNLAFPAFAPYCTSNATGNVVDAMWMNDVGELGAIYNRKINLKIDGGSGHSGSPVFYCPDGNINVCAGTEKGFVISVWSGWNGFETTAVGAKGPEFRAAAIAAMDAN